MVPGIIGISLLAHVGIIAFAKTKKIFDYIFLPKLKPPKKTQNKILFSLLISLILETIFVSVTASSALALYLSFNDEKSNYRLIQSAIVEFKEKSVEVGCILNEKCYYEPLDASIPLS